MQCHGIDQVLQGVMRAVHRGVKCRCIVGAKIAAQVVGLVVHKVVAPASLKHQIDKTVHEPRQRFKVPVV